MTDIDIKASEAKPGNRSGPSAAQRSQPERGAVDRGFHREIEALLPRLTRYARSLTRDVVAADELVQDCLGHALGKIHLWKKGTDLRAWLFTILHNRHISLVRREARERANMELQKCSPRPTPAPDQIARLELRDLQRAFAKLPQEQRSVILLVGLEGMRYDEAASVVHLPVGTVRSRVARGRENLRVLTGLFPRRHSGRPSMATSPDQLSPDTHSTMNRSAQQVDISPDALEVFP